MTKNENQSLKYSSFLHWNNQQINTKEGYSPDSRSGEVYLYDPKLKLATEIAIVTQRPLLLLGEPGSGKSSYAPFVARNLKWHYHEYNVTGRTEAKDLLWRFDALGRLRDAQGRIDNIDPEYYVTPGVLWQAFDYEHALNYVAQHKRENQNPELAGKSESTVDLNAERDKERAVVLIDEIDKADPNVPNDLLEVIGKNSFTVDETNDYIQRKIPILNNNKSANKYGSLLIIITSNGERDLPPAFVRRCIVHTLEESTEESDFIERWKEIAKLHVGKNIINSKPKMEMINRLAKKCWDLRRDSLNESRRKPSIAEFLDALRICFQLNIKPDSAIWEQVERNVLIKNETIS